MISKLLVSDDITLGDLAGAPFDCVQGKLLASTIGHKKSKYIDRD